MHRQQELSFTIFLRDSKLNEIRFQEKVLTDITHPREQGNCYTPLYL